MHLKIRWGSETLDFLRDATADFNTDTFVGGPNLDEVRFMFIEFIILCVIDLFRSWKKFDLQPSFF